MNRLARRVDHLEDALQPPPSGPAFTVGTAEGPVVDGEPLTWKEYEQLHPDAFRPGQRRPVHFILVGDMPHIQGADRPAHPA